MDNCDESNNGKFNSFLDWIPPSGQQATQQKQITTPSPPDQVHQANLQNNNLPGRRGWHPPTPDLYPSPSTELTSSGRDRVQAWTSSIGVSPRGSAVTSAAIAAPKKKVRMAEIRKISNIQPGQIPGAAIEAAQQTIKRQSNGLALPQKVIFDPWNACTTGHQRAENRLSGSISWRESRENKLKVQFADTSGSGGKRMYDTVGAGSKDFGKDGRTENGGWVKGAPGLRKDGQQSIVDCFRPKTEPDVLETPTTGNENGSENDPRQVSYDQQHDHEHASHSATTLIMPSINESAATIAPSLNAPSTTIFQNTCIYINGSTYPLISDHLLRQLIVRNGGQISIALARRSVSHVILTHKPNPDANIKAVAAGGGLAAGKVRKEVERKRAVGVGVKYVTAHWIIESVKAGKRLPEGRFADWRFVERGQEDMRGFFGVAKGNEDENKNSKKVS